jgi:U3 small nucleolar RNA-associated protein 5
VPCLPQAQSLSTLLIQALQTNDKIQFEACLGVTDQKVIEDTVARLPLGRVVPFLAKVIGKFESSPSRGVTLTRWIRAVLTQHTSHLMSAPDLVRQLSGLYQVGNCCGFRVAVPRVIVCIYLFKMIDSRLNVFKPLLKLSGRLDLVLAQVAIRGAGHSKPKPASTPRQAFVAGLCLLVPVLCVVLGVTKVCGCADEAIDSDEEGLLEEVDVGQEDEDGSGSEDDSQDNIMEDSDDFDDE